MVTRLRLRNFKRFGEADVELGKAVVLIGPNNSGKTTVLQALALWSIGLRRWNEKRQGKRSPEKRPGVTVNRRDLISIPVPNANLLWRDLHVRNVERAEGGKPRTQNVRIEVIVEGVTFGQEWECGLEFDYANEESFYCRPLRTSDDQQPKRMPIPPLAADIGVAYLPPMSGLAAVEPKWEPGRVNVLIGEGQTAQVLRNLCYQIWSDSIPDAQHNGELPTDDFNWDRLVGHISSLFGVTLLAPRYVAERGEITLAYKEGNGPELDLSSAGRGLQQTLLLLAHLYANPKTILLLDEPDAHLEILRQRQIYGLLTEVAGQQGSQVIAASHSEVLLTEAAERGTVIAFVGKPHRIDDRGAQLTKSLKNIGWEQYYEAEQRGWVLYLEDATDLAILQAFADILEHPAKDVLQRPFVYYVTNQPQKAREHFFGLREAKTDLVGVALFDRLDRKLKEDSALVEMMWRRRGIENYLCAEQVLLEWARGDQPDNLFAAAEGFKRVEIMQDCIREMTHALEITQKPGPWSSDIKATDDFLDPLFSLFFKKLELPVKFRKSHYHELVRLIPKSEIDAEVAKKLNVIQGVANRARPRTD